MSLGEQQQRVLDSLIAAGSEGVTRADWSGLKGITPDGGPPIANFIGRVNELKDMGLALPTTRRRDKCKVFIARTRRALEAPELRVVEPVMGPEHFEALSLAALAPAPRNAIHDEDAVA